MKKILKSPIVIMTVILALISVVSSPSASAGGSADIILTPILMPHETSPAFAASRDKIIADALADTLKTSRIIVTDPTDYTPALGVITYDSIVFSQSTPEWGGTLNPTGSFAGQFGPEIWVLVDARSVTGGNDISLDMLSVTVTSNDGGVLNSTITFTGLSYSSAALVVQADGTIITSGSASQKGKRVLVLVRGKLFNGGATQGGLDQVKAWFNSFSNYMLTYTAQIIGDDLSISTASVSAKGSIANVNAPSLWLLPNGTLSVTNGAAGQSYRILQQIDNGPWTFAKIVTGTNNITVPTTAPIGLFKAQVQ